jgi:hypothetical protein
MWEAIQKAVQQLLDDPKSLLIVLGVLVFLLGVSGRVPYVPISGHGQTIAQVFGAVLVLFGFFLVFGTHRSKPYGVEIRYPTGIGTVKQFEDVIVDVKKRLPEEHQLWIVRIYQDDRYYPIKQVKVSREIETYTEKGVEIGGNPGESRDLGAFLFGPAGQALIAYQREAAERHNTWVNNCAGKCDTMKPVQDERNRYLPAFRNDTIKLLKTIPCHTVSLQRG